MRRHPLSLALRYLKGQRTMRSAPYHGAPIFENEAAAIAVLYDWTGQQFGNDPIAWGEWLRKNRRVYNQRPEAGQWATVTKIVRSGSNEWRVRTDDGRLLWARITAKVRTTKVPILQVGDRVRVAVRHHDSELCEVLLSSSPVVWVPS